LISALAASSDFLVNNYDKSARIPFGDMDSLDNIQQLFCEKYFLKEIQTHACSNSKPWNPRRATRNRIENIATRAEKYPAFWNCLKL